MTERELRNDYVRALEGYLGAREGDERHRELIDWYNRLPVLPRGYKMTVNDDWCVAAAVAVAVKLGLTEVIFPECSCTRAIALYRQEGRFVRDRSYIPQVGDFVVYDWQGNADPDHWGTVAAVEGDKLTVIEGNMTDRVDRRSVTIGDKRIYGYCLPDYGKLAEGDGFADVPQDAWYAEAVALCASLGLMVGREDGTFDPAAPVTRAELAAVTMRLHKLLTDTNS
ncbi:MAG: S-layer homology domain-containing protein [Oscillospiraceae bacterium]|nr:S-layer homology domain-containing protein [Oscillospiraceae bacterium]MBR2889142.1 S-layer homology domain-containing protein [Oscillospiraceae bacterium]